MSVVILCLLLLLLQLLLSVSASFIALRLLFPRYIYIYLWSVQILVFSTEFQILTVTDVHFEVTIWFFHEIKLRLFWTSTLSFFFVLNSAKWTYKSLKEQHGLNMNCKTWLIIKLLEIVIMLIVTQCWTWFFLSYLVLLSGVSISRKDTRSRSCYSLSTYSTFGYS